MEILTHGAKVEKQPISDSIDAEFNNIKHNRGIVSMARSSDPNSAGSQFFIVHKDSIFLMVNTLFLEEL